MTRSGNYQGTPFLYPVTPSQRKRSERLSEALQPQKLHGLREVLGLSANQMRLLDACRSFCTQLMKPAETDNEKGLVSWGPLLGWWFFKGRFERPAWANGALMPAGLDWNTEFQQLGEDALAGMEQLALRLGIKMETCPFPKQFTADLSYFVRVCEFY